MTQKLTRADLLPLEQYAERRDDIRQKVIAHKGPRRIALGDHLTLCFEDLMTMQYQVQEMLRAEKIFEADGIEEELSAYNPLIPDGSNWKATLMIEYLDVAERDVALRQLVGIEQAIIFQIGDNPAVSLFADEDIPREREEKTAAVHFMRFELNQADRDALAAGARISAGVSHANYRVELFELADASQASLKADIAQ